MPRDPRAYLWDALRGTELLAAFSAGRTFGDYQSDAMVRSAVERQDDALVWRVLVEKRPVLEGTLRDLLGEPAQESPATIRRDEV